MFRALKNSPSRFSRNNRGNIGMLMGLLVIPLVAVAGAAVDMVRQSTFTASLQSASDAGILAASKLLGAPSSEQQALAFRYMDSNLSDTQQQIRIISRTFLNPEECAANNPVSFGAPTTCLETVAEIDTYFMRLYGVRTLQLASYSQATITMRPMEISFGFDVTGSMKFGNRWEDATGALSDMLDILKAAAEADGDSDSFRVSLVPFTDRVMIPSYMEDDVLDPSIPLVTTGSSNRNSKSRKQYVGCVEPREETIDSDVFVLTDKPPSEISFRPSQIGEYGDIYGGPTEAPTCLPVALVAPTSDVEKVKTELNKLVPRGTGRFDIGAAWVWRTLSPKWRGVYSDADFPRDRYNEEDEENIKVAVIITDGNTIAYRDEVWLPGDPKQPWGWNKGTEHGFEHFVDVCHAMAHEGIHVHMVNVAKSGTRDFNANFIAYAQDCASQPDYYYQVADVEGLIMAFRAIGEKTSQLRLTR